MLTYTNSSLTTFERCPRRFDLRYRQRLSPVDDDNETLTVGSTWHHAHDVHAKCVLLATPEEAAYAEAHAAIARRAPGELWNEKLRRLFACYGWRWRDEPIEIVRSEIVFRMPLEGDFVGEGQIDALARIDGELGIVERKTAGEDIGPGAPYWDRLRMDSQLSFYWAAFGIMFGNFPRFIVYDVVRKPTIKPKAIVKKDAVRMRMELKSHGACTYYGEGFTEEELEAALYHGHETARMYGARLTADVGDRPDFYFARRVIPRTSLDARAAELDVLGKIKLERFCAGMEGEEGFYPRNTSACMDWNRPCDFIGLCANNEYPRDEVPSGFVRREHLHPELHPTNE